MFDYALKNYSNIKVILKIFLAIGSYKVEIGYDKWYGKYKKRITTNKIQRRVLQ